MTEQIWSFKYEPKNISEMILNNDIRPKLEKAIKEVPNLLLYGSPGIGKGTFTKILLKETGLDYMWVNASDKTGIEYIRNDVRTFAHAASKQMKIVVFNEADALSSGQSGSQKILRQLIEDTNEICRYIFLANYDQYIIPELKSRCEVIPIDNPPLNDIAIFASKILKAENISYEPKVLATLVKKCYPDIRKTIWVLQENSINGKLTDARVFTSEELFSSIADYMIRKDLDNIRRVIRSNYVNYKQLYEYLYENVARFESPGGAILLIAQHLHWDSEAANKEINFMSMVVDMINKRVII